ncbi:hypothetical protein BSLG_005356 [Batrachochytrium salamandrivorans]|nr:hypothetical protein BSLG_005356 [Batrachochytrium salamandrivorans]
MDQNRGIVKELVEILAEANQVIPGWLTHCRGQADFGGFRSGGGRGGRGGRGRGGGGGPRFGATDYRREQGGGGGGGNNSNSGYGSRPSGGYGGGYGNHSGGNSNSGDSWF